MIAVIGSTALNFYKHIRTPIDLDLVGTYNDIIALSKKSIFQKINASYPSDKGKKWIVKGLSLSGPVIIEAEIAWDDSLALELLEIIKNDPETIHLSEFSYASLNVLYMLKMSHKYLRNSPHFLKTMRDIQLMRSMGAKIRPEHKDFYKRRKEQTYWYAHPSLNQSKEDFFKDDGIVYQYDHDSLHIALAIGDVPAYTLFAEDDAEVKSSKEKFFKLPLEIQLNAGIEEAMTLSAERALIPFPNGMSPDKAFKFALMKVCTSITSGWFRNFCWNHYDDVIALYEKVGKGYENKLADGIANGTIKPFKSENS